MAPWGPATQRRPHGPAEGRALLAPRLTGEPVSRRLGDTFLCVRAGAAGRLALCKCSAWPRNSIVTVAWRRAPLLPHLHGETESQGQGPVSGAQRVGARQSFWLSWAQAGRGRVHGVPPPPVTPPAFQGFLSGSSVPTPSTSLPLKSWRSPAPGLPCSPRSPRSAASLCSESASGTPGQWSLSPSECSKAHLCFLSLDPEPSALPGTLHTHSRCLSRGCRPASAGGCEQGWQGRVTPVQWLVRPSPRRGPSGKNSDRPAGPREPACWHRVSIVRVGFASAKSAHAFRAWRTPPVPGLADKHLLLARDSMCGSCNNHTRNSIWR